nr:hypothetical protein [Tanacetum cinerariifolium]
MRGRTSSEHIILRIFCPVAVMLLNIRESGDNSVTRRMRRRRRHVAPVSEQDEDVALAMRLQREKFTGAFRGSQQLQEVQQQCRRSSVTTAMANLRAMASRAVKWLIFELGQNSFKSVLVSYPCDLGSSNENEGFCHVGLGDAVTWGVGEKVWYCSGMERCTGEGCGEMSKKAGKVVGVS